MLAMWPLILMAARCFFAMFCRVIILDCSARPGIYKGLFEGPEQGTRYGDLKDSFVQILIHLFNNILLEDDNSNIQENTHDKRETLRRPRNSVVPSSSSTIPAIVLIGALKVRGHEDSVFSAAQSS